MIRSLYTAATGMKSQQLNIDTISNNLSNVNTTSYKANRLEFKDLMYQTLKRTNLKDEEGRPVNLQVGHGVHVSASTKSFAQGSLVQTDNVLDVGIDGDGFFEVSLPNGESRYTRDGSFKLSVDNGESKLVTNEGYFVLNDSNSEITIEENIKDIVIDQFGNITGVDENNETVNIDKIKLVNFMNPEGLLSVGGNLYQETSASSEAFKVDEDETDTTIRQGYIESSNVEIVKEMVRMISAQRAYEISSKSITTSDEMMQMANNLKR